MVLSAGIKPAAHGLGRLNRLSGERMADDSGIEPLTVISRHARFRGELEHLLTYHPLL